MNSVLEEDLFSLFLYNTAAFIGFYPNGFRSTKKAKALILLEIVL